MIFTKQYNIPIGMLSVNLLELNEYSSGLYCQIFGKECELRRINLRYDDNLFTPRINDFMRFLIQKFSNLLYKYKFDCFTLHKVKLFLIRFLVILHERGFNRYFLWLHANWLFR